MQVVSTLFPGVFFKMSSTDLTVHHPIDRDSEKEQGLRRSLLLSMGGSSPSIKTQSVGHNYLGDEVRPLRSSRVLLFSSRTMPH